MTPYVLWLDGCFGAGKTTTARLLLQRRPELLLLDPELIGSLLWQVDPSLRARDFRGLRLWRRLVVEHVTAVLEELGRPLVVPMSVFEDGHAGELVGELHRRDVVVHHVRLVVDEEELRRRISAQRMSDDEATDVGTREFRLGQLPAGLAARTGSPLQVAGRSPDEVADEVLGMLEL